MTQKRVFKYISGKASYRKLFMFSILFSELCMMTLSGWVGAVELTPSFHAQRFIVKYRSTLSDGEHRSLFDRGLSTLQTRFNVGTKHLRDMHNGAHVVALQHRVSQEQLNQMMVTVAAQAGVELVEEDRVVTPTLIPNDTKYTQQWNMYETNAGINMPGAWDKSTGVGIVVAVIDTGYRPHADLISTILPGYDFISDGFVANDGDGRDADARDPGDWSTAGQCGTGSLANDSSWHGTHVAGTIGAQTNNNQGIAGIAFNTKIVPVRVLGRCGGYISDVADGIIWASGGSIPGVPLNVNPARAVNLSLGASGACGVTLQNAIDTARTNRTTVVVAAGNMNTNAVNTAPANCQGVITVASVNRTGGHAFYSNYGANVDIAAPGGDMQISPSNGILSTLNTGATVPGADSYAFYQGTSMATPHVTGVVALMLSANSALLPDQIKTILKTSARSFPANCRGCGAGIVDATAAVVAAKGSVVTSPAPTPSACPAGYTTYSDKLSARGTFVYEPSVSGLKMSGAGMLSGKLTGPLGSDFDLALERLFGSFWVRIGASQTNTSIESVNYPVQGGQTYRWIISSYMGSGAFSFCSKNP